MYVNELSLDGQFQSEEIFEFDLKDGFKLFELLDNLDFNLY